MPDESALAMPDVNLLDSRGLARPSLSANSQNPDLPKLIPVRVPATSASNADVPAEKVEVEEKPDADDKPEVEETPEGDDKAKPEEKAEGDDPEFEVTDEGGKKVTLADLPPQLQAAYKREITKARNRARAEVEARTQAETRLGEEARRERERADQLARSVEQLTREPPRPREDFTATRPRRDSFETPDAYDTALTEWASRKAMSEADARATEQKQAAEREAEAKRKTEADKVASESAASFNKRLGEFMSAGKDKHADFQTLVGAAPAEGGPSFTFPMTQTLFEEPNGVEVAYHLAKNVTEANRIAALAPHLQVREITKLAEKLAKPPPRPASKAPAPIERITTRAPALERGLQEMSMDEYAAQHPLVKRRDEALTKLRGTARA